MAQTPRAERAIERPGHLPAEVAAAWDDLGRPTGDSRFDPEAVADLPPPVARWLRRSIPADTPLARAARLTMQGEIRIGRWIGFTATQVLSLPDGFVWAASAGIGPLRITGFDRFTGGTGEMRWRLMGRVPVMSATGDDVSRSAAGRLAAETTLIPTACVALGVPWTPVDDRRATAGIRVGDRVHHVTVEVDDGGALRGVQLPRWGDPDGGAHALHTFGVEMGDPREVGGLAVPTTLRAGWWPGTDRWAEGEFFRAMIDRFEPC